MAVAKLVDPLVNSPMQEKKVYDNEVTGWVVYKVENWERSRNAQHQERWKEYYRIWRGQHAGDTDKIRSHERSKIIAPALQQSIEAGVSEMEETIFHRKRWFDLEDDVRERIFEQIIQENQEQISQEQLQEIAQNIDTRLGQITDQLLEDFETRKVNKAISEILLNAGLYGTGIGKITVEKKPRRIPLTGSMGTTSDIAFEEDLHVSLVPVDPNEFVIDVAAKSIESALGVAHMYTIPRHEVLQKQERGIWNKDPVGFYNTTDEQHVTLDITEKDYEQVEHVEIMEYHGLVPKGLFKEAEKDSVVDPLAEFAELNSELNYDDAAEMVECIVWIANRGTLLKIVRNPFIMQDRSFVAFQWDTVPNRFWGRGIAEKGYNPQKALDAELRARIDALALATYPVMLVNGMMAPRNSDFTVRPGRNIIVSGPVNEAIAPFKFPGPDAQSYRQTAEFERMVTMATGSLDTAAPLGVNPRNETAGGMSMMMGALLKRAKRTLRNMEYEFLSPLIHKIAWRYMQFDTERYPVADYRFKVHGALGAQAREFEVAQLTQLLQTTPPGSPAYWIVLKGVIKNYNVEDKEKLMLTIDTFLQNSLNPQPPQPDFDQQVKMAGQRLKEEQHQFTVQKTMVDSVRRDKEMEAEAERDRGEALWNQSEAMVNVSKAETERMKAESDSALKQARAADLLTGKPATTSSEGTQPTEYLALVDALKASYADITAEAVEQINTNLMASIEHLSNRQQMFGMSPANLRMNAMDNKLEELLKQQQQGQAASPNLDIVRSPDGRVASIGGRAVRRGLKGELSGLE
jgi:hypothetical protein